MSIFSSIPLFITKTQSNMNPNLTKFLLIIFQIQFILQNYETYLNQLQNKTRDLDSYITEILKISNCSQLTFLNEDEISNLKLIVLLFASVFQVLIFIYVLVNHKTKFETRFSNVLRISQDIYLFAFFIPTLNYSLRIIMDVMENTLSPDKVPQSLTIAIFMSLILLICTILNLTYFQIIPSENLFARMDNKILVLRFLQGFIIAILNLNDYKNPGVLGLIEITCTINLILELVIKFLLFQTVPFYKFEVNVLFGRLQSISLIIAALSLFYHISHSAQLVSWNYNIFYATAIFFIFLSKIESSTLYLYRNSFEGLIHNRKSFNRYWRVQHLLLILQHFNQDDNHHLSSQKELLYKQWVRSKIEKREYLNAMIMKLSEESKENIIKLIIARQFIEEGNRVYDSSNLIQSILTSNQVEPSIKYAAKNLKIKLESAIKFNTSQKVKLDFQKFLDFHTIQGEFKANIIKQILNTDKIFHFFETTNTNFFNFFSLLSIYNKLETNIEKAWINKCMPLTRQCHNLLIEYAFYCFYLKLDYVNFRKAMVEYNKLVLDNNLHFKKYRIDNKTAFDPENAFLVIEGEQKSLGIISQVSSNVQYSLGYLPSYLKGKPLNILMPDFMHKTHDLFIKEKFIEKQIISEPTLVSGLIKNSHGFLTECQVLVNLLPSLHDGIKFSGLIRFSKSKSKFLIVDQNDIVQGYSKEFAHEFGLIDGKQTSLAAISQALKAIISEFRSSDVTSSAKLNTLLDLDSKAKYDAKCMVEMYSALRKKNLKYSCEASELYSTKSYKQLKIIFVPYLESTIADLDDNEVLSESNQISYCDEREENKRSAVKRVTQKKAHDISESYLFGSDQEVDQVTNNENFVKRLNSRINPMNSAISSASSKASGDNVNVNINLASHSRYFQAWDIKMTLSFLLVPLSIYILCLVLLYTDSHTKLNQIRATLDFKSQLVQLDKAMNLLNNVVVSLYNADFGANYDQRFYMATVVPLISKIKIELTKDYPKLSARTKEIYDANIIIYDNQYTSILNSSNHHKGKMIDLVEEILAETLYVCNKFPTRKVGKARYTYYMDFLFTNFNNDLLLKFEELKLSLRQDLDVYIDNYNENCNYQIIFSSITLGISGLLLIYGICLIHDRNTSFLSSLFRGNYSEAIEIKHSKLAHFQEALETGIFTSIIEEEGAAKVKTVRKSKSEGEKSLKKVKTFSSEKLLIFSVVLLFVLLLMITLNQIVVLIGAKYLASRTKETIPMATDLFKVSNYYYQSLNLYNILTTYGFNRKVFGKHLPMNTTFYNEIVNFDNELNTASQEFSLEFHEKLYQNICSNMTNQCKRYGMGSTTKGAIPALRYVQKVVQEYYTGFTTYPFLSFNYIMLFTRPQLGEAFTLLLTYLAPFLENLTNERSQDIINVLNEGSDFVVKVIITGILMSIFFRIVIRSLLMPKILEFRQNSFRVLMILPLKAVINNRAMREFLIKDSKEFINVMKRIQADTRI